MFLAVKVSRRTPEPGPGARQHALARLNAASMPAGQGPAGGPPGWVPEISMAARPARAMAGGSGDREVQEVGMDNVRRDDLRGAAAGREAVRPDAVERGAIARGLVGHNEAGHDLVGQDVVERDGAAPGGWVPDSALPGQLRGSRWALA